MMLLAPWTPDALRAEPESGEAEKVDPAREARIKSARLALYRLERSIETEGYFSARINLNVWRKIAMDAGVFDRKRYEEFKRRIHDESIERNLNCFKASLLRGNVSEARNCLDIWSIHSKENGVFDPEQYKKYKSRLK